MKIIHNGDAARGRRLISESGHDQTSMVDREDVLTYLCQQRDLVEMRGSCDRCESTQQIEHYATGKVVCPNTLETCPGRKLCKLLKLFRKVNS